MTVNIQIQLARRPGPMPVVEDFAVVESPIPTIGDNEILIRHEYMSLDPYMVGRMRDVKSYAASVQLGDVMGAHTVGEVVASNDPAFKPGDKVSNYGGWQLYTKSKAAGLRKVDARLPLSLNLGILGMPGATAYIGLFDICQPKEGETVVVTAAAGAVGSLVGQMAKLKGCRVVGIAGGADKCRMVIEEFGFDACIDYKAGNLFKQLVEATPKGVDCVFENVGGEIFDTILRRLNPFSRIAICGLISQYAAAEPYGIKNFQSILVNRVKVQGFIVGEHLPRWPDAYKDMSHWYSEGKLKVRETIEHGIRNAPTVFLGLLKGANTGKLILKLED